MKWFLQYIRSLSELVFPDLCIICHQFPKARNHLFCIPCLLKLPLADLTNPRDNVLKDKFWGRVPVEEAAALFIFRESGLVQNIVHSIKYHNRPDIARELGKFFGKNSVRNQIFQSVDLVTAVPLHPKKLRQRGFNQSSEFGKELAKALQIPFYENIIERTRFTETQTLKTRMERIRNVKGAFRTTGANGFEWEGCHILIVDDIVTTGATLEACIFALREHDNVRVSIGALGLAYNQLII